MTVRRWVVVVLLVVTLAACGDPDETVEERGAAVAGAEDLPFGLVRCPEDYTWAAADPSLYRDRPVYVADEMPTEAVRAWAQGKPGFEQIWIDRDHNGWISVGFSEGAAERQAELAQEFPDVGVVAVPLDWTGAELDALRDRAFGAMEDAGLPAGGSASVPRGLVEVMVGVLDEEHLAPLADLAGPRLCVTGVEPEEAVQDGPQPTEGDGWRLLGSDRTGPSYRTGVATTPKQYEALWAQSGIADERPDVDFEDEIVIWFGAVYGSSCPIRMDDVIVDEATQLVHGLFVVPGNPQACTSDANPEAYVVALQRDRLPAGGFIVQLHADDPPSGVPEERTIVDVDLRSPGSTARDEQIHPDQALIDEPERYVVAAGGFIEPDFPAYYDLDLSCSFSTFGPLNDVVWQSETADLDEHPPAAWTEAADGAGVVEVELLLQTGPARLTLTANGHSEQYTPASDGQSDCS